MGQSNLENAKCAFQLLKDKTVDGVRGVLILDSGQPGPVVGITVCTHGNEFCGLSTLTWLLRDIEAQRLHHTHGKIIITLNNMAATEAFLASEDPSESKIYRFTEIDMNRLPLDFRDAKWSAVYEVQRSLELEPIWARFDYSIDIHSTSAPSIPMIVELNPLSRHLSKSVPIQNVVSEIVPHLAGRPVASLYGHTPNHECIIIEGGQHEVDETHEITRQAVANILFDLGILNGQNVTTPSHQTAEDKDIYNVTNPIVFPNESYEFTRLFGNFETIAAGTVIAKGDGEDIVSTQESVVIFPKPFFKPAANALNYEMMFLAKKERVASPVIQEIAS
jgi:predicted deacylase